VSFSEDDVRQAVDKGVAHMRARRRAEQKLAEAAREFPEMAAREMLVFATTERDRLRDQLLGTFGFSVSREGTSFRCRFVSPGRRPRTSEEAARWIDAVVALAGFEMALDWMWLVASSFPPPDRARMICNAFSDVMRETPAVYAAFANCQEEYAPGAKEYASAMLAAWARSHLKSNQGIRAALEGPNREAALVSAALMAWRELGPDSPIVRSTRFRDWLREHGEMQKDGRRKKAPGPPAFVNLVDRFLSGRDSGQKTKSPEHELATFAEREALLRLGRKAGLPPREMQLLELFTSNPGISNPEAARELKIAVGTVKSLKHRIKRTLESA
jgi:DNA-binding CsgD family transcriptional regulator